MSDEQTPIPQAHSNQSRDEPMRAKPSFRWLRLWFGLREPVNHRQYAATGFGLMLLKYVVEAVTFFAATGAFYSPLQFLVPSWGMRQEIYRAIPEWLLIAHFLWTLPFQWIAVSMSIRRNLDYGASAWWGLLVLVPFINYFAMLFWCLPYKVAPRRSAQERVILPKPDLPFAELWAMCAGVATFAFSLGISVYGLDQYGAALFFATPIMVGASTAFVLNTSRPRRTAIATMGFVVVTLLLCGLLLLAFALEGAICIIMAAPIFLVEGIFGALIGWVISHGSTSHREDMFGCIAVLPVLALLEGHQPPPPMREVLSVVEIAASPEVVWRNVVSFPELPPPAEWFFRAGIACPERARIDGQGVGATRYCEFSTGAFVEPIRVWDEPQRLAFDVTQQPPTMRELSPWGDIHPPHLDFVLNSRRGEFRLVALPNGHTRLEGRTWYDFDMGPRGYWAMWGDYFIHRIHLRVLNHIRELSESQR